jgi:putative transposase
MSIRNPKIKSKQPSQDSSVAINAKLQDAYDNFLSEFQIQARESIHKLVQELFEEEVQSLAGERYNRGRNLRAGVFRAGSDPGSVKVSGQRMAVRKPRLKQDGKEVTLQTYSLLQDWDLLTPRIIEHMVHGVSTRSYEELLDEIAQGLKLSKSAVSRAFNRGSKQALELLQSRSLVDKRFAVIMIDGIHFGSRNVIVAVGVTTSGYKMVLGIKEGNTESAIVCVDLLQDLVQRGLSAEKQFLFVIDGGKGIRSAITTIYGESALVQRCMIHKGRNIKEYLPECEYPEFARKFRKIQLMDHYSNAKDELRTLHEWLKRINSSAAASLQEAGEELITVQRIGAHPILRRSINNTNIIESIFSTVRHRTQRVKNWTDAPDKVQRWTAVCLLHAEKSFPRMRGYFDCNEFVKRVEKIRLPNQEAVA